MSKCRHEVAVSALSWMLPLTEVGNNLPGTESVPSPACFSFCVGLNWLLLSLNWSDWLLTVEKFWGEKTRHLSYF